MAETGSNKFFLNPGFLEILLQLFCCCCKTLSIISVKLSRTETIWSDNQVFPNPSPF